MKEREVFCHPIRPKHLLQTPVPLSSKASSPPVRGLKSITKPCCPKLCSGETLTSLSVSKHLSSPPWGNAPVRPWWKKPICTFTGTNAGGDWAGKEVAFSLMQSHCSRCAWWAAPGNSSHMEGESSTTSNGCTRLSNRKSASSFSYVHFWKMIGCDTRIKGGCVFLLDVCKKKWKASCWLHWLAQTPLGFRDKTHGFDESSKWWNVQSQPRLLQTAAFACCRLFLQNTSRSLTHTDKYYLAAELSSISYDWFFSQRVTYWIFSVKRTNYHGRRK